MSDHLILTLLVCWIAAVCAAVLLWVLACEALRRRRPLPPMVYVPYDPPCLIRVRPVVRRKGVKR